MDGVKYLLLSWSLIPSLNQGCILLDPYCAHFLFQVMTRQH